MEVAVTESQKIPVGISSCLLGENVRYNGGHKRSRTALNLLGSVFEYSGFCPEVAIGLGVPRETIHIADIDGEHRVVGSKTESADHTEALFDYGLKVGKLSQVFSGYILMKNSPSCALYSAKVQRNGHPMPGKFAGIFVRGLQQENPLLPCEEEGRLNDPVLRENFVAAVYAYHDWRINFVPNASPKALVAFHSRYKYLLMAHSQQGYKKLGQLVANLSVPSFQELIEEYISGFMGALKKPVSRKGHVNVLFHILGYLRDELQGDVRQELADVIESYRKGHVNLSVPATMLNHYLKRYGSEYINEQAYLKPYAEELGLRNTI